VTTRKAAQSRTISVARATTPPVPARFSVPQAEQEGTSAGLGQRLKRIRFDKSWTLEDVSQRTGVARSTLSKIENGQMSPTYDVLQKIVRGTGLDIVELFDSRQQNAPSGRCSVTRRGEGKPHLTHTYHHELLATDLAHKQILPFKSRVAARSLDEFPHWVRHQGEEFLYVLSGRIQLHTEFYAPAVLDAGDSAYFDSKMGHAIISLSEEDAEILWTCTGITLIE
jgi:transcriptional regulator with XRE-family HTH domain